MSVRPRRAQLKALAKINLSLKVLGKRPDGYHELRTIFQTISLADRLEVEFTPASGVDIHLASNVEIPDNLVVRAARLLMERTRLRGRVSLVLDKRIPVGAGLGGGSSDAAAVLLALPVLAGVHLELDELAALAAELGSDVPFFLHGGTALGLGRGTELYPLPEAPNFRGIVVAPQIQISTAEAYRALGRKLTSGLHLPMMSKFTNLCWSLVRGMSSQQWSAFGENDFESVAFRDHPSLAAIRRKLRSAGAGPVLLSGSGSAVYGIFSRGKDLRRLCRSFADGVAQPFVFVSRARYRRLWWRSLGEHLRGETWPPQSRYAR